MGFKCGIVGLPNVGKSSLFNALTRASIAAENYPFCTIDPNVGIVEVPDPRLGAIAGLVNPAKVIAATMEFVDIAGLVAGASKGEGLGNQFLAHIRETNAIAHVVRCFEDENITHVSGQVDPLRDIETIDTELALADLETMTRAEEKAQKLARSGDKKAQQQAALYGRVVTALDAMQPIRSLDLSADDALALKSFNLITAKPVVFVANVSEGELDGNDHSRAVEAHAVEVGAECITICAAIEAELAQLTDAERGEFLSDLGLEEAGLDRFIRTGYRLLGLQTYFTAGPKECRAWTIRKGLSAPGAAGVIHTDFERGFIRAEIIGYEDYMQYAGESGARDAGRLRLEGKEYIMHDGDVVHFRFNV